MSLIEDLDDVPGGDKFQELYDKFNANNAWYVRTGLPGLTVSGNNLTLHREGGASETVALPVGGDRIISGLAVTISGTGPYTVNVAPGQWSIAGTTYTLSSPLSTPLTAPDPTLDRIDAVFATNAGTVIYVAGVASETPAAPVPGPGQFLVNYISVPATGIPGPTPPVLVLPPGTLDGQVLMWDAPTNSWVVSTLAYINSLLSGDIQTLVSTSAAGGASLSLRELSTGNGRFQVSSRRTNIAGSYFNIVQGDAGQCYIRRDVANIGVINELVLNDFVALLRASGFERYIILSSDNGVEVEKRTIPPTVLTDRLYNLNGNLFWSGNQICTAPCGGGYVIQKVKYSTAGPHTIVPAGNPNEIRVKVAVGSAVTINLPTAPADNLKVVVKANVTQNANSNPITIAAPANIEGGSSPVEINTDTGSLTFIYYEDGLDSGWLII